LIKPLFIQGYKNYQKIPPTKTELSDLRVTVKNFMTIIFCFWNPRFRI